jgi:cytochrome oxidase Cu insertion factor (SCO1/SenC/PrrC family)
MKRLLLLCVALLLSGCQSPPDDKFGMVDDFKLTLCNGSEPKEVSRDDLKGKVWLGAFIFTRCNNSCPVFSDAMKHLQQDLAQTNDFRLVSITLDPEHDTPERLREYAARFQADPNRWLFLRGDEAAVHKLSTECFKLAAERNPDTKTSSGNEFMHARKVFLVDRHGQVRGYYNLMGDEQAKQEDVLKEVRQKVAALVREK